MNTNSHLTQGSDCLALTVRKEYRLKIFTNTIQFAKRITSKVSLMMFLLNLLNIIL